MQLIKHQWIAVCRKVVFNMNLTRQKYVSSVNLYGFLHFIKLSLDAKTFKTLIGHIQIALRNDTLIIVFIGLENYFSLLIDKRPVDDC
jgi:hypothetical protein